MFSVFFGVDPCIYGERVDVTKGRREAVAWAEKHRGYAQTSVFHDGGARGLQGLLAVMGQTELLHFILATTSPGFRFLMAGTYLTYPCVVLLKSSRHFLIQKHWNRS